MYIGYNLMQSYWGMGIIPAALHAVIDHLSGQENIYRLWADYDSDNRASGKVLEKCGFIREGLLTKSGIRANISPYPRDTYRYSMLFTDHKPKLDDINKNISSPKKTSWDYSHLAYPQQLTILDGKYLLREPEYADAQLFFDSITSRDKVSELLNWQTHTHLDQTIDLIARWRKDNNEGRDHHWIISCAQNPIGIITAWNKRSEGIELEYYLSNDYWG